MYDENALRQQFPNLDRGDVVTFSLVLSGTDASGKRRHFARQLVLIDAELHAPAQPARPRRRSAQRTSLFGLLGGAPPPAAAPASVTPPRAAALHAMYDVGVP